MKLGKKDENIIDRLVAEETTDLPNDDPTAAHVAGLQKLVLETAQQPLLILPFEYTALLEGLKLSRLLEVGNSTYLLKKKEKIKGWEEKEKKKEKKRKKYPKLVISQKYQNNGTWVLGFTRNKY